MSTSYTITEHEFEQAYTSLSDVFFRYLKGHYHMDDGNAADIIADSFCKNRDNRSNIRNAEAVTSFCRTVFKNTAKDFFKKHDLTPFSVVFGKDDNTQHHDGSHIEDTIQQTPLDHSQNEHERTLLQDVLASYDDLTQDILFWKYAEQRSFDEIATITGLSSDSVRQKASRASKKIKKQLGHIHDE